MAEQRSAQWLKDRENRVTGSMAGAILGDNPWMSREQAMQEKLGYRKFEGNSATVYGQFHEGYALADFEVETGLSVKEVGLCIHPEHDWLAASPDGLIDSENACLEIKCPYGIRDDKDPYFKDIAELPHYYAQIQIEMFCTGTERTYFYQWNPHSSRLQIVRFDPEWIEENFEALEEFYQEMIRRKSEDDSELVREYHQAVASLAEANERLNELKDKMIELAKFRKTESIEDIPVRQIERKGSVDYKKIPELEGVDLEKYRKKPSKYWKVG